MAVEGTWARAKDPQELLDYWVNFTDLCVDKDDVTNNETITASTWTPASVNGSVPADLQVLQTFNTGKYASAFFAGGINGAAYDVTVHATTDEAGVSRQHERTYRMIVRSR